MQSCLTTALAGDWHGNHAWARRCLEHLATLDVREVIHLGDFGVWPGQAGRAYLRAVDDALRVGGMTMFVVPGNHEDYDQIAELPALDLGHGIGSVQWMTDRIGLLPRNHQFERAGWSVVALGGAPSIDFEGRIAGQDWWSAEAITEADVDAVLASGPADIMLAHDAPGTPYFTDAVRRILESNPLGFGPRALAYAAVGRDRMTRAFEAVQPRVFAHGHFHVADERTVRLPESGHDALVVSMDCDGSFDGNVALLHLPPRATGGQPRLERVTLPSSEPTWRGLDRTPQRPVRAWGTSGFLAALDSGRSAHWRLIVTSATAEPHGLWVKDLREAMAQTNNKRAHDYVRHGLTMIVDFPERTWHR